MTSLPASVRRVVGELRAIADEFDGLLRIGEATDILSVAGESDNGPLARAKLEYARRRSRQSSFTANIFGEPAWDMMLDLFIAQGEGKLVSVSSLCIAGDVPSTTALRWINILEQEALITRVPDPRDGRRRYLSLSSKATAGMVQHFNAQTR